MELSSKPAASAASNSTHVSLFMRNLRFLDLDLLPDWPNFSSQLFSAKDTRQRIKCVEWALYRLFELWDAEETNTKLRPFFPPLEPLQSLNLRAAVFRCLSDLKKNGALGKDVSLRKTMLDDCRGDKFEELLALFSTLILRKVASQECRTTFVGRLATAPSLTKEDQQALQPLIVAHRVSLQSALRDKARRAETYQEITELLGLKELELDRRAEELKSRNKSLERPLTKAKTRDNLREVVGDQWTGDLRWADAILNGGQDRPGDSLLQLPFDEFLEKILSGRPSNENEETGSNLLEGLNAKIAEQRSRLEQWKAFHASIKKNSTKEEKHQQQQPTTIPHERPLKFQEHQDLTLEGSQNVGFPETFHTSEYDDLLSHMNQELSRFRPNDQVMKRSNKSNRDRMMLRAPKSFEYADTPATTPSAYRYDASTEPSKSQHVSVQHDTDARLPSSQRRPNSNQHLHVSNTKANPQVEETSDLLNPVLIAGLALGVPEDQELDQKISFPSPTREPKSPPILSTPTSPTKSPPKATTTTTTTLLERTRQSMSLVPNSHDGNNGANANSSRRPRPSASTTSTTTTTSSSTKMTRPSSSRHSTLLYPVNPFQTPNMNRDRRRADRVSTSTTESVNLMDQAPPPPSSGESTPREELFSQEADYASVFKSRPRVALSPDLSPSLRWNR